MNFHSQPAFKTAVLSRASIAAFIFYAGTSIGQTSVSSPTATHTLAPASSPEAVLEKILISGEQPGPGLWKVLKENHVLWIIATQEPVQKKMTWRTKQVESIIAQSQEVIGSVGVSVSMKQIGYFRAITLLPAAMEARKNPDGKTLRDIVPADVYARWAVLRDKYIGDYQEDDSDIERRRPMFAALELYSKAISQNGLTSTNPVRSAVDELAKKYKVKVTNINFEPAIGDLREAVKELKSTNLADVECFTKTVARIESDLALMRARANAWATGDINALRTLPVNDQRAACTAAIENASFVKTLGIQNVRSQVEAAWMKAAEAALTNNVSSLTVLPMREMFSPDGYLAKLKSKGYVVIEPDAD